MRKPQDLLGGRPRAWPGERMPGPPAALDLRAQPRPQRRWPKRQV